MLVFPSVVRAKGILIIVCWQFYTLTTVDKACKEVVKRLGIISVNIKIYMCLYIFICAYIYIFGICIYVEREGGGEKSKCRYEKYSLSYCKHVTRISILIYNVKTCVLHDPIDDASLELPHVERIRLVITNQH